MRSTTLSTSVLIGALATLTFAIGIPASQCNTSAILCCDFTGVASQPSISNLLGLLGITVQDTTGFVGVTCVAISPVGLGSFVCSAQPVCCTNNSFGGVVALGCTPVDLSI